MPDHHIAYQLTAYIGPFQRDLLDFLLSTDDLVFPPLAIWTEPWE